MCTNEKDKNVEIIYHPHKGYNAFIKAEIQYCKFQKERTYLHEFLDLNLIEDYDEWDGYFLVEELLLIVQISFKLYNLQYDEEVILDIVKNYLSQKLGFFITIKYNYKSEAIFRNFKWKYHDKL
jgi:hypothetical protein